MEPKKTCRELSKKSADENLLRAKIPTKSGIYSAFLVECMMTILSRTTLAGRLDVIVFLTFVRIDLHGLNFSWLVFSQVFLCAP
jgi:hypothetical protein